MQVKSKVETIEEYLARGGSIKKIAVKANEPQIEVIRQQVSGHVTIMTLEDADLFFGEYKPSKAKKQKAIPKLDISALPESLRKKFLSKLRDEENDGEEEFYEEEDDEDSDADSEEY